MVCPFIDHEAKVAKKGDENDDDDEDDDDDDDEEDDTEEKAASRVDIDHLRSARKIPAGRPPATKAEILAKKQQAYANALAAALAAKKEVMASIHEMKTFQITHAGIVAAVIEGVKKEIQPRDLDHKETIEILNNTARGFAVSLRARSLLFFNAAVIFFLRARLFFPSARTSFLTFYN